MCLLTEQQIKDLKRVGAVKMINNLNKLQTAFPVKTVGGGETYLHIGHKFRAA